MNVKLLMIVVGISLSLGFTGTAIAEKEFDMKDHDDTFTIIENPMRYVMPYKITGATINDISLNCDEASLDISIASTGTGVLQLDLPRKMYGGIFMILVDGNEWDDVSIVGNVITVNFPEETSKVKIIGSYYLTGEKDNDGVCDLFHNPPYSYIISPLKQFRSDIPIEEMQCRDSLILVMRHNGYPACVNFDTIPKLIQRGWIDTDPRAEADKNIPKYLCELYGGGFFDETGECMDVESSYKCQMSGGEWDGKCMIPNHTGKGIGTEPKSTPEDDFDIPEVKLFLEKYLQAEIQSDRINESGFHFKQYAAKDSLPGGSVWLFLVKNLESGEMDNVLSCPPNQYHDRGYVVRGSDNITEYLQRYDCLSDSDVGEFGPAKYLEMMEDVQDIENMRTSILELEFDDNIITVLISDETHFGAMTSFEFTTIPVSSLVHAHDMLPETSMNDRIIAGSILSEIVKAGTYITQNDDIEFWYTIGGIESQVITIELQNHEYDRIVFVSDNNKKWIEQINDMIISRK